MKKIYNKLVRDKIPEIIRQNKAEPKTRILEQAEYLKELFRKLGEEVKEAVKAKNDKQALMKEIGDVYEVIGAIMDYYKIDREEVIKLKNERKIERGGFKKRIFLESVN